MTVSEWTKSANFADLPFAQSALYVLAPGSVPEAAGVSLHLGEVVR